MSTVFGHGRLRLYLLKLLDESPRHGYEIISLLRDRFLGVYSPSPGTIYPRLARLEEEGLVTHTEEGGRKVYRLTDKGREELREREHDLHDLEREITDSVRDIARAVKQDVRETISSLRQELKYGGARRGAAEESAREEAERGEAAEEPTGKGASEKGSAEEDCGGSGRWGREWERFSQGFGAFGAVWGRGGSQGPSEFDRALHEFSDRVRDVAREAGSVGEAAAHDLRRILDDTVEVIRRDMRNWGPPRGPSEAEETSDRDAPAEKPSPGTTGSEEASPEDSGTARPMPPADGGDPWGRAVDDPDTR
ncbi:PadR family transcriptional regulator [Nocardiopsis algeriensis]|uniref:PadR family transcriptional regulator n=1 Tax=Nocardiopsis algeriensis TaxID=1478215 RepID=UPI003B4296CD